MHISNIKCSKKTKYSNEKFVKKKEIKLKVTAVLKNIFFMHFHIRSFFIHDQIFILVSMIDDADKWERERDREGKTRKYYLTYCVIYVLMGENISYCIIEDVNKSANEKKNRAPFRIYFMFFFFFMWHVYIGVDREINISNQ